MKRLRNSLNTLTFLSQWFGISLLMTGFMFLIQASSGVFSGTTGELLLSSLLGGIVTGFVFALFSMAAATAQPGCGVWVVIILLGATPLVFGLIGDVFTKLFVERFYTGSRPMRYTWKNLFQRHYLDT